MAPYIRNLFRCSETDHAEGSDDMRFAFIFINECLEGIERTSVRNGDSLFVGVRNVDEACSEAQTMCRDGVDCIELCGAFGEEGARRVMDATERMVPVGYITHLPEMDEIYDRAFGGQN